ncbi:alkaline phosphatase D family protein [Pseudoxanthomonas sp. CF125]|uniref:alkaline phosphatase D family protein n=1 Tax=Pseudoxanthomonas sp. CF125 TaxID=1855303 RepID=UPI00088608E6|nr:alkaline phosphatase D family protein [Pseudoxanthomonas sp. CF125]SDR05088.1 alkaline phosphatase D [Pseudoxanthomonas sp. CF125]
MTVNIERRRLVVGGALGLGALMLPVGRSLSAEVLGARGFTHNVASGEPASDSMLLWTRYAPAASVDEVRLDAEVALDRDFTRVVSSGSVRTGAYRDWTAKLTMEGLQPGTSYWYRFIAPDGGKSPVGRTKTLPVGDVDRFGLGLFSCSNLPMGWFNAYAHAAARDDLDLWLHVGDYIYEYGIASYKDKDRVAGREVMPAHDHEMISLIDYRLRFACYRADPDLQKLHQMAPMVALWDDHEITNDSWEGGAQNHQPQSEGDWNTRRAAAMQAYREWMPVSEEPWKAYSIGTLATLYRTESRLLARTRPASAELAQAHQASDPEAALRNFRDGAWRDPTATMLGSEQESWLAHELKRNAPASTWQMVGMGTIIGRTLMPEAMPDWVRPEAGERAVDKFKKDVRASKLGLPMWMDRWDGYPAARSRLLRAAQHADADLVMLSGDSHNAWAYSLAEDGQPAGVEFAGHSVTSNGMEEQLAANPKDVAGAFVATNPELVWADTSQRGYMMIDITPQRVAGEWLFMRTTKSRSTALAGAHRMSVERGRRKFSV